MEFLTPEEILKVLAVAKAKSPRDHLLILFAFKHGLRRGEVTAIRLSDIKDGALTTARLKGSKLTVQPLMPHKGEPLLDELRGLREYLKVRPRDAGDALFVSGKGGALTPGQFRRVFREHALAAGLSPAKAHPHALKHSAANLLVRQGMNPAEIMVRLGHASINSTMRYISLTDAEAADKAHDAMMSAF